MSLLSNRGRFSQIENNNKLNIDADLKSVISSSGKNPLKLFKITKKTNTNKSNNSTVKDRIKELNKKDEKNVDKIEEISNKHQYYNSKIKEYNDDFQDKYSDNYKKKKKKINITLIIGLVVLELFTLIGIVALGTFIRYKNMTQNVVFNKSAVQNNNIDESTLEVMKGYKTVAIFGLDSRTGSVDKGNNSDVNLIVNLNLESGEAQMVSIYRDLYLSVTDQNIYDKINSAYRRGGPEAAVKAINKNLDLNVTNFFSFNWKAVADGIELLGGVDIDITKAEYRYMNAFIHETCIATGIDSKNPAGHYIKSSGMQHLDGVQAVAYGRLRLMDSDFQRVERQKKVIALCLEKAKRLDISKLKTIIEAILPQIAYEFDVNEMFSILKLLKNINISASAGVPETNNFVSMDMGSSGDCIVPISLEKAVVKLHEILFNDYDYKPSKAVIRYSNRIIELRKQYVEENEKKASIKASIEEESKKNIENQKNKKNITKSTKSTISKVKKKVSTSSNGKRAEEEYVDENGKKVDTDPSNTLETEEIVPVMEYEEEPETDNEPVTRINSGPKSEDDSENESTSNNSRNNVTSNSSNKNNTSNNNAPFDITPDMSGNMPVKVDAPIGGISPGGVKSGGPTDNSSKGVVLPGPPTGNDTENMQNVNNTNDNSSPISNQPIIVDVPGSITQNNGNISFNGPH